MKILIVAGGTGGHLFPAARLAEEIKLRAQGEILFVTSCRSQDRDILKQRHIEFQTLPLIPLQTRTPLSILNFIARLIAGTIKSVFLLLRFRPLVAVGFGGYISGPILLSAALFRIKTIIHEQNVYPGKTNRILAGFVDKIAISFPETRGYLRRFDSKIIISGNPLRRGLKREQKTKDIFTILAMGGSQGAHALNKLIPEAAGLIQADKKRALEIIHISGYREEREVIRAYQDRGIKSRVFSFTEEIDKLYNECDFVIGRAGATTVSELSFLAKPSILIPYPYGGGHQRLNAKVLQDRGSAILLDEEGLRLEDLRDAIIKLMDKKTLTDMSERQGRADNNACSILMKLVLT